MSAISEVKRDEMGITHSDFRRIFPRLVEDANSHSGDLETEVIWDDGRQLRVSVSPEQIRKIALLRIPYVNISFEFQSFSSEARDQFMVRFDRAFHKGGG